MERCLTTHDTPQHNGIAESLNCRLLEQVQAILNHSGLPKTLWAKALHFAIWLKNCTSTHALSNSTTPLEKLTGNKPNLSGVPKWGQTVWIHSGTSSKLNACGVEAKWVGFDIDSPHAHRIYWLHKNSVSMERNIKFTSPTTTVTFYPGAPRAITLPAAAPPALPPAPPPAALRPLTVPQVMCRPSPSVPRAMPPATPSLPPPVTALQPQTPTHPPFATDSREEEMPEEEEPPTPTPAPHRKGKAKAKSALPPQPTRKSTRTSKPSYYITQLFRGKGTTTGREEEPAHTPSAAEHQWYHPDWTRPSASSTFLAANFANSEIDYSFVAKTTELIQITANELGDDPKTLTEVQSQPDWPKWQEAMDHEMKTLEDAGTWTDVPQPTNKNVVSSKWVFRIKHKADGTIKKYKARLVACGFTQRFGINYFDTYSPVARLASIRTILAIAARNDWEINTFDFNGAYLNGELNDNEQIYMEPPPRYGNQGEIVKFLLKSLYGLKQAGRKWYDTLVHTLADLGFHISDADPGVFYAHDRDDITMLASHVDDCVITRTSKELIADYKQHLNAIFSLTDLGSHTLATRDQNHARSTGMHYLAITNHLYRDHSRSLFPIRR